jgi:F-box and leucine-rich repeat protein 2/20
MSRLFGISDDNLILIMMSWLDLRDYGLLDLALTNVVERKRWMICLSSANLNSNLRTIQCTHSLLRWLIKRKIRLISMRGITALSHGCKELRTIDIDDCEWITDDCLFRIAEGCPELTSFTLSRSDFPTSSGHIDWTNARLEAVTNAGISRIARGCKKLTSISIIHCRRIDDTALRAIGSSCHNLREITLKTDIFSMSMCLRFSNRGLIAIARGCPALESISISDCPNITDAGMIVLAQKCFQLKSITFYSSKITDASLIAFAKNSRKLQRASFCSCDCITSTGLSILSVECTQMQKMRFSFCKKVGEENLLSLRREYFRAKTFEHIHPTSALSMLRNYFSCK